jgi:hypothetical protein
MTREQWQRVWAVYESACEMPAPEREAFVRSSLEDGGLRAKALELLSRSDDSIDAAPLESGREAPAEWILAGQTLGDSKYSGRWAVAAWARSTKRSIRNCSATGH